MTDTLVRTAGPTIPDVYMVTADQETILGNGTTQDPLRAGASTTGSFQAELTSSRVLGAAVYATTIAPTVGIVRVSGASSGITGGDFSDVAQVVGLVVELGAGNAVNVRSQGLVVLTESEWGAVIEEGGALSPGVTYFLSAVVGQITATAPVASGAFVVQVGIALNSTTLLLSTPTTQTVNP